jgi:hypothetical protein
MFSRPALCIVVQELQDLQIQLDGQQHTLSTLTSEEKQMDRFFKKEFAEADASLPKLLQLYKARLATPWVAAKGLRVLLAPGEAAAAAAAAAKDAVGGPLGPEEVVLVELYDEDQPEGLDLGLWARFVEYRDQRGRLELHVREETAKVRSKGCSDLM